MIAYPQIFGRLLAPFRRRSAPDGTAPPAPGRIDREAPSGEDKLAQAAAQNDPKAGRERRAAQLSLSAANGCRWIASA